MQLPPPPVALPLLRSPLRAVLLLPQRSPLPAALPLLQKSPLLVVLPLLRKSPLPAVLLTRSDQVTWYLAVCAARHFSDKTG